MAVSLSDEADRRDGDVLEGLNPVQREAVACVEGAVLVLAGAGTGKTRVLTRRLAHILASGLAWPSQILAVTFTNKAAQEMRARVAALTEPGVAESLWLGTFHGLAARMLRVHAPLVGLPTSFTILDPDDQIRILKPLMESHGLDTKKNPPRAFLSRIERLKDRALRPGDVGKEDADQVLRGVYRDYQARLLALQACDFGDLLLHMITILRDPAHTEILESYHRKFRYLLVDEYQDTNTAQYLWLRLLARGSNNICCVGDDDQSIYGWRGAEVENILKFEHDFPDSRVIRLEQNYRSTGHILGAASGLIAQNSARLGKTLWSAGDPGEKVSVRGFWSGDEESAWAAQEIGRLIRTGLSPESMAVLVRAGFQTRSFEESFVRAGVPYKVIGGPRFYERQEIRDALAYLRVLVQPADDLALERIINTPKRGVGATSLERLRAFAREKGISLYDAVCTLCETDEIKPSVRAGLSRLMGHFNRWREWLSEEDPEGMPPAPADIVRAVLEESGYLDMWRADKTPEGPGRVENLNELIAGLARFESLPSFLDHVALVMDTQDSPEKIAAVSLMTLHGAKGLEFDAVFLAGWEEGLFPSQRSMDEKGAAGLEEERRLAYVGITRARKKAFISFATSRMVYGSWLSGIPSRFIAELPAKHVEIRGHKESLGKASGSLYTSAPAAVSVPPVPKRQNARDSSGFMKGSRVQHGNFGMGTVVHVDGHKLDIAFDQGGMKRVMDSFITLAEG